jgi:hypothetical protein
MDAKTPPQETEASREEAIINLSAHLGDQVGRLMGTMGANPHIVALAGLRMVIAAMAHLAREDQDTAKALARYIGSEMLAAVDELGLRDKDTTDGA